MQRVCVLLFVFRVSYAMIPFQLTCSGLPPKRCQEHGQHCAHSLCPGDMFDDNLRSVSSSCVGKLVRRFGKFLETWLVVDSLRLMTCGAVACYSRNVSSLWFETGQERQTMLFKHVLAGHLAANMGGKKHNYQPGLNAPGEGRACSVLHRRGFRSAVALLNVQREVMQLPTDSHLIRFTLLHFT